jgi:hypothetical protein
MCFEGKQMVRAICYCAIVVVFGGCGATAALTYHNKYLAMWERQLDDYRAQLNYQQQLVDALNRPRTCTVMGNFLTCQ